VKQVTSPAEVTFFMGIRKKSRTVKEDPMEEENLMERRTSGGEAEKKENAPPSPPRSPGHHGRLANAGSRLDHDRGKRSRRKGRVALMQNIDKVNYADQLEKLFLDSPKRAAGNVGVKRIVQRRD